MRGDVSLEKTYYIKNLQPSCVCPNNHYDNVENV